MDSRVLVGFAAAVLVLSLAAMVASALQLRVKLAAGCLSVSAYGAVQPDGVRYGTTAAPGWLWPPHGFTDYDRGGWGVVLPLWMPTVLAAGGLGGGVLVVRRTQRRVRGGLCQSCGYSLMGITGPCPECGGEPKSPS
jgi:hypothetical protein